MKSHIYISECYYIITIFLARKKNINWYYFDESYNTILFFENKIKIKVAFPYSIIYFHRTKLSF